MLSLDDSYIHYDEGSRDPDGYIVYNSDDEGCPTFIPKNKTYNVLKYHSDYRVRDSKDADTNLPSLGVISDGYNLDIPYDEWNTEEYQISPFSVNKFGSDRFLNLTNQREVADDIGVFGYYTDESDKSVMNLPIVDELRAVDGNSDYVFNLFKKAESITVSNAVTGDSLQTVDTLEFSFHSSKIEKCQKGWVTLQISNFELTGYTNDNMLYCYYWEGSASDTATTEAQVTSGVQPITDPNFRMLNNENTCVQCFRMSDVASGSGKKLIIGCNKFTTVGEELYINMLIGLKPADVCRHYQYREIQTSATPEYTVNNCSFDEVGAPVFKYKSAEFKFSGLQANTWNNKPLFWPSEGFMNAQAGSSSVHILNANFQYLDSNNEGIATPDYRTTGNTRMGIPNGGTETSIAGQTRLNANRPSTFTSNLGATEPTLKCTAHGSYNMGFSIAKIGEISGSELKQDETFILRLPQCYGAMSGTASGWDGSDNITTFSSASFNVNLYVGDPATQFGDLIKWQDLADSLYLLETWPLSSFYSSHSQCYNYSAKAGTYPTYLEDIRGYPDSTFHPNVDQDKIDQGKFVTIDMADIIANGNGVLPDYAFYIALESAVGGISRTHTYSVQDNGGTPTGSGFSPSGYDPTNEPEASESAVLKFKSVYDDGSVVGSTFDQGSTIGNCGSMFFKAPQIVDIGVTATAEDYYQ